MEINNLIEKYDSLAKEYGIQFWEYDRNQYSEGMDIIEGKLQVLDEVLKDLGHLGVDWSYGEDIIEEE